MARFLVRASSQSLKNAGVPVATTPLSIAAWVNVTSVASPHQLICGIYEDNPATTRGFVLMIAETTGYVRAYTYEGATQPRAASTAGVSTGTWCHVAGVWASSTSRAAYMNGGNKGTDTTDATPSPVLDSVVVGRFSYSGYEYYFGGGLAEIAIWNTALSDGEVLVLSKGFSPILVHPQNLICHWQAIRTDNDLVGGYHLTPVNSPTWADHPGKIFYPAPVFMVAPGQAAEPGPTLSIAVTADDMSYYETGVKVVG